MAGIYSERVIAGANVGAHSFTVPAGKRLVLMTITLVNGTSTPRGFDVSMAGVYLLTRTLPGPSDVVLAALRTVLYAGETLSIVHSGNASWCTASGYLFEDNGMELSEAARVVPVEELELPEIEREKTNGSGSL